MAKLGELLICVTLKVLFNAYFMLTTGNLNIIGDDNDAMPGIYG